MAQYKRDSVTRERQHDERGSSATRKGAIKQERWRFNNQPAQERHWSNERRGDATTSQHKRGTVSHKGGLRDNDICSSKSRLGVGIVYTKQGVEKVYCFGNKVLKSKRSDYTILGSVWSMFRHQRYILPTLPLNLPEKEY